jgi:aryl-alcohol dehydrogenase-like predicted oxidoreductase
MAFAPRILGRTGLEVGPLGLGASFGIADADVEWALDHGCNYLYWGTFRRRGFGRALEHLCRTRRQDVVLVVQSYARLGKAVELSLHRALRRLGTDHADVLLLGWWQDAPWDTVARAALRARESGKTRFLGLSTHNRLHAGRLVAEAGGAIDVVHVRYNAAHRGAEQEVFPHRLAGGAGPGLVSFTATRWGQLLKTSARGRTPTAGDCYRFALSRPEVDLCLCGPRNGEDIRAAVAALERGPMSADELAWMREAGDRVRGQPAPAAQE